MRLVAMVLLTGSLLAFAGENSKKKEDVASDVRRSCTGAYSACVSACANKKDCVTECQSDCEVCAIDFGEEPMETCHK